MSRSDSLPSPAQHSGTRSSAADKEEDLEYIESTLNFAKFSTTKKVHAAAH